MSTSSENILICGLGYVGLSLERYLSHQIHLNQLPYRLYVYEVSNKRVKELIDEKYDYQTIFSKEELQTLNKYTKDSHSDAITQIFDNIDDLDESVKFSTIAITVPYENECIYELVHTLCRKNIIIPNGKQKIIFQSTVPLNFFDDLNNYEYIPSSNTNDNDDDEISIIHTFNSEGLNYNKDYSVIYIPERSNPISRTNIENYRKDPKIVWFSDKSQTNKDDFYNIFSNNFGIKFIEANHPNEAILSKLLENSQRGVNIAFLNEVEKYANSNNINFNSVLSLARTKHNFLNFTPGMIGGACAPLSLKRLSNINLCKLALDNTKDKPNDIESFILDVLKKQHPIIAEPYRRLLLSELNILFMGLTIKPNYGVFINSPALTIAARIGSKLKHVAVYDPYITKENTEQLKNQLTNSYGYNWFTFYSDIDKIDRKFDAVIILINHTEIAKIIGDIEKNDRGLSSLLNDSSKTNKNFIFNFTPWSLVDKVRNKSFSNKTLVYEGFMQIN